jgi:SAM-dependent methyltransferase
MEAIGKPTSNVDVRTVAGFGQEWQHFDQNEISHEELERCFQDYFSMFPWEKLAPNSSGVDVGCGSGRWTALVAKRTGRLLALDASREALNVARSRLAGQSNVSFACCSVEGMPVEDETLDFAYSLGVLHHVPDTVAAMKAIATKLKSGAPFLVYLYYRFDESPFWFKGLWWVSNLLRTGISRLPFKLRLSVCQLIALTVYWPLARMALILERLGKLPQHWPLAFYRDKTAYIMRTDALDRFGTRLEKRFTRAEIQSMLEKSGFRDIQFSSGKPYWVALCKKK